MDFSKAILCGDSRQQIRITPKVDEILRYLRLPYQIRYLWIDAICLNQRDLVEKAVQVHLMRDIYRQGSTTHIYLQSSVSLAPAFADLEDPEVLIDSSVDFRESLGEGRLSRETDYLTTLDEFVHHPWFTRRWVLQEVANSAQAIFRNRYDTLAWPIFIKNWNRFRQLTSNRFYASTASQVARGFESMSADILKLLWDFQHMHCTNPLDKLYSLYGLVDSKEGIPKIDYTLSAADLFTQLVISCAERHEYTSSRIISALLRLGSLRDLDGSRPSWVPAWTQSRFPGLHAATTSDEFVTHKSVASRPQSRWTMKIIATIEEVSEALGTASSVSGFLQDLQRIRNLFSENYRFRDLSQDPVRLAFELIEIFRSNGKLWSIDPDIRTFQFASVEEAMATWNETLRYTVLCTYCNHPEHTQAYYAPEGECTQLYAYGHKTFALAPVGTKRGDHLGIFVRTSESHTPGIFKPSKGIDDEWAVLTPAQSPVCFSIPVADFTPKEHRAKTRSPEHVPGYYFLGRAWRCGPCDVDTNRGPSLTIVLL